MSFGWCVYTGHSNAGDNGTRPIAWAKGSVSFSDTGYKVPSESLQLSGTPGCFRRRLGLLVMAVIQGVDLGPNVPWWHRTSGMGLLVLNPNQRGLWSEA
jgi:hypothetical protein